MCNSIIPNIINEYNFNFDKIFLIKDYNNKKIIFFSNDLCFNFTTENNIFDIMTSLREKFFEIENINFDNFNTSIFSKEETKKIIYKNFSNFTFDNFLLYKNTLCFFLFLYHVLLICKTNKKQEISYIKDLELYVCDIENKKIKEIHYVDFFSLYLKILEKIQSEKNIFIYNKKSFINAFIIYYARKHNIENAYFSMDISDNIFVNDYEKELEFFSIIENLEKNACKILEKTKIIMIKEYFCILFFYFSIKSTNFNDDIILYLKFFNKNINYLNLKLFFYFDQILKNL